MRPTKLLLLALILGAAALVTLQLRRPETAGAETKVALLPAATLDGARALTITLKPTGKSTTLEKGADGAWTVEAPPSLARHLRHADWLGRMTLRDGPALAVITPEGQRLEGLSAWRSAASLTPVSLLAVATPMLVAPQVQTLARVPRAALEELLLLALAALILLSAWTPLCSPRPR